MPQEVIQGGCEVCNCLHIICCQQGLVCQLQRAVTVPSRPVHSVKHYHNCANMDPDLCGIEVQVSNETSPCTVTNTNKPSW